MKSKKFLVPVLATVFALTACASEDDVAEEAGAVETSEAPTSVTLPGDNEYSSVEDLRDALVDKGFRCLKWERHSRETHPYTSGIEHASTSGACGYSDDGSLYVFISEVKKADYIDGERSLRRTGGLVVGKNWVMKTDEAEKWAEAFGAMPVTW